MNSAKKYTIYTKTSNLTMYSMIPPEFQGDLIIITKLSGNAITFIKENVVAIDVSETDQQEKTTVE